MSTETQNLGLVKAIHSGATPPTNTAMIWYDTINFVHKYWNGAAWTLLGGLSSILTGKKVWVDGDNGNDSTGLPYRIDLPFATIEAARDAASAGDLVEIYPATTTYTVTTSLLKDGVSYWSWQGVNVQSNGIMFDGDTTLVGETITGRVGWYGYAVITDVDGDGRGILAVRTNPLFDMVIECNSLNVSNISNGMVLRDGITRLLVRGDYTVAGRPFRLQDTANLNAEVWGTVSCTFGSNFNAVFYSAGLSWDGTANIKAKTFSMPSPTTGQNTVDLTSVVDGNLNIELEEVIDSYVGSTQQWINNGNNTACKTHITIGTLNLTGRKLFRSTGVGDTHITVLNPGAVFVGGDVTGGNVYLNGIRATVSGSIAIATVGHLYATDCLFDSSVASVVTVTTINGRFTFNNVQLISDNIDRRLTFNTNQVCMWDGYYYKEVLIDNIFMGNLAGANKYELLPDLGAANLYYDDVLMQFSFIEGAVSYVGGSPLSIYSCLAGGVTGSQAIVAVLDPQFITGAANKVTPWVRMNNNYLDVPNLTTYIQSTPPQEGLFLGVFDDVTNTTLGDGTVRIRIKSKDQILA